MLRNFSIENLNHLLTITPKHSLPYLRKNISINTIREPEQVKPLTEFKGNITKAMEVMNNVGSVNTDYSYTKINHILLTCSGIRLSELYFRD